MSYLGIDIGMTGAKALLVGEDGSILERKYTDYCDEYKRNLQTEINPLHIWNGVKKIIQACQCNQLKDKVKTISVSVSGDDFFPADKNGNPLANVISAYHNTGVEYENYIIEKFGSADKIFDLTGQPIFNNVYPLHRILWIKEHQPNIYKNTWKFMGWEEYINYLLTGRCISDYSLVSRTLLFDIYKKQWLYSDMEKMNIENDKFPEVAAPGEITGKIKKEMADELNLPVDCQIVTGGFDQATACIGAGVTASDIFSLSLGTVAASHWLTDENYDKKKDYSYCCSLMENRHMGLFFTFNGCAVLNWFFREIIGEEKYDYYNSKISPDKPSSLFFMPHLGGAMQPYNDPLSKGTILGLKFDTKRHDILKAIYEGIAFDIKRNYQMIENSKEKKINVVGGGSRSAVWMQILANITGSEVNTLKNDEGSAMAVAILGTCANGAFKKVEQAVETWIKKKETFVPDSSAAKEFEEKYQKYKSLYESLASFNHFLKVQND